MAMREHNFSVEVSDNVNANDNRIAIPVQIVNNDAGARWTNEIRPLINYDNFFVNQADQNDNNEQSFQAMDN